MKQSEFSSLPYLWPGSTITIQQSSEHSIPPGNLCALLQGNETEVGIHCSLLIQKDFRRNYSIYAKYFVIF